MKTVIILVNNYDKFRKLMNRPFFKSSIIEIEELFDNRNVGDGITDILHELSFRNSKRAKKMLFKIKNDENKKKDEKLFNDSKNIIDQQVYTNFKVCDDEDDLVLDNDDDN